MKQLKTFATNLGMGIGLVYALFLWEPIYSLFVPTFIVLLRQVLVLSFAVCVLINPEGMIRMGESVAPKISMIIDVIFGRKKNNGT